MLVKFQNQLQQLLDSPEKHRFLVAASSGVDSTVLIHLCHRFNLDFGICHVNFQLRAKESDADQKALEDLADILQCPIYVLNENAKIYAEQHKLSTQMAAREIRYNWFKVCLQDHQYDYLLTAHHADDNLETFFINTCRGTGIKGLTGIPQQRDDILRPLLNFTREDISTYAKHHSISWREDQSNASDKYLRNIIRHHLTPFFQKRHDNLYARFQTTLKHINRQEKLLEDYMHLIFKQVVVQKTNTYRIKIEVLQQFPNYNNILIELLKDFGFSDWDSIVNLLNAQTGKYVTSSSHKLVKERGFLELFKFDNQSTEEKTISLDDLPKTVNFNQGQLHFELTETFEKTPPDTAFLSKDLLKSDLCLRPYKIGDYFCPLGMKGRRKLSDFLKDEKLTTREKSNVWVLTHLNEVVWVICQRIDNRFKVTKNTNQCLKIQYLA